MERITLDSSLSIPRPGGAAIEIPAVRLDGFRVRPQYAHLCNSLGLREDSGEIAVVQRALDYIATRPTEVMYTELRAARFLPAINEVPLGARTFTFAVMDVTGVAERVTGAGRDLPRAGIKLSEVTSSIGTYGAMYSWTTEELRAFDYANGNGRGPAINLDTRRGDQAMLMIARKIDSTVAFGDPDVAAIRGMLNNANVHVSTAAYNWLLVGTTFDQLLAEMLALANYIVTNTKEMVFPDTMLLPTEHLLAVQAKRNAQGTLSVLEAFNAAMTAAGRKMTVESWPLLATADTARTGPRAVCYKRDPEVGGSIIPALFIAQPPQPRGLEWQIPCEGICGGAAIRVPLGFEYRDLTP